MKSNMRTFVSVSAGRLGYPFVKACLVDSTSR